MVPCLCVCMLFKSRQIPIKDAIFWPTWVHSEQSTVGPSTGLKFRAHLGPALLGSPLCGLPTLSRAPQWSHVHTLGAGLWWGKLCICVLACRPQVNSVLDHWKKNQPPSNSVSVFTEISFCNITGVQLLFFFFFLKHWTLQLLFVSFWLGNISVWLGSYCLLFL